MTTGPIGSPPTSGTQLPPLLYWNEIKACYDNISDLANARRFLHLASKVPKTLVVAYYPQDLTRPAEIFLRLGNGKLDRNAAIVEQIPASDTYLNWCKNTTPQLSPHEFGKCAAHSRTFGDISYLPRLLAELPRAAHDWQGRGWLPASVELVDADSVDSNLRFLGAPNGVIDLDTGQLASPHTLTGELVASEIPDDFDPAATDPDVDRILPPIGQCGIGTEERLRAEILGHQLRNRPDRAFVAEICEPGSGKTTFANALLQSLGPYVRRMSSSTFGRVAGAFRGPMAYNDELVFVGKPVRVAFVQEVSGELDAELLKLASGGEDKIRQRSFHQKSIEVRPTALLWFQGNPKGANAVTFGLDSDGDGDALAQRAKYLERSRIANANPSLLDMCGDATDPLAVVRRQAVVARCVEYAHAFGRQSFPSSPTFASKLEEQRRREMDEWKAHYIPSLLRKATQQEIDDRASSLKSVCIPNSAELYDDFRDWFKETGQKEAMPAQRGFTNALFHYYEITEAQCRRGKLSGRDGKRRRETYFLDDYALNEWGSDSESEADQGWCSQHSRTFSGANCPDCL